MIAALKLICMVVGAVAIGFAVVVLVIAWLTSDNTENKKP